MNRTTRDHIRRTVERLRGREDLHYKHATPFVVEEMVEDVLGALCFDGARMVIPVAADSIEIGAHVYGGLETISGSWPTGVPVSKRDSPATLLVLLRPDHA